MARDGSVSSTCKAADRLTVQLGCPGERVIKRVVLVK